VSTEGSAPAEATGRATTARFAGQEDVLRTRVAGVKDATLEELRAWLLETQGIKICFGALQNTLQRMGLRFKKSAHAAEQERPDVQDEREAWQEAQSEFELTQLVFIDETWLSTNMARRCGRCPKGERLKPAIPTGIGRPPPSWPA
jgi:hypothetical protein